ncbi:aspartate carbamoyltransferase [Arenicella xantha]|uniref:Aspartate carbamoyltransferase n=1 Tax=Arenicella xantha TaxID=644221 RepID=A0A395JI59_9GAMM|nr:aspartate carbamoyltransferase [Arenicella xantha]RBP49766.1 aspartate carbamoyltransferase [Arenicella xantha]
MLPFKSLISSQQLTPNIIKLIFAATDTMADSIVSDGRIDLLDDKVVALLFFEPSSRTMMSFQSAAQRLKAGMVFAQNASSTSFEKGESLEDLIRMVESYADIIVMRHALPGSASIAAQTSAVPFINAGDGGNEHPTQALIDAYTIYKEKGRLDNLDIVFGYDSLQSRSIHSLSRLLSQYANNRFTFTGPAELLPSQSMLDELRAAEVECEVKSQVNLHDGYDVAYVNRLQEERFVDRDLFERNRRKYRLTRPDVEGSNCLILDPLPRIDEICTEVDDLPNAVYFKQASYGVPVRMALLAMLLDKM